MLFPPKTCIVTRLVSSQDLDLLRKRYLVPAPRGGYPIRSDLSPDTTIRRRWDAKNPGFILQCIIASGNGIWCKTEEIDKSCLSGVIAAFRGPTSSASRTRHAAIPIFPADPARDAEGGGNHLPPPDAAGGPYPAGGCR